jgi:phage gp36-like protein
MPYATQTEFIEAFGAELTIELTNLEDPTATTVDATVMTRGLTRATSLIDSYLSGRYALPLSTTPAVLTTLCLDIARYQMGHNAEEKDVRQRYEDALKVLEQIAKGTLNLGLPPADEPTALPQGSPAVYRPEPVFSRTTLEDY